MPRVEEYKEEKSNLSPLAKWIRQEAAQGFNFKTADEKAAEEAQKATANKEYYNNLPAFKRINASERQGVMDSYDDYFTNNYSTINNLAHSRFMGYAFLSYIAQDAFIRRAVSTRADEMTRAWGELSGADKEQDTQIRIEEITKEHTRLQTQNAFRKAANHTGYFGGCLVYMDIRSNPNVPLTDEELATPIYKKGQDEFNKAKLKGLQIVGLQPIEPINIAPSPYNTTDPTDPNFYEPEYFYILGKKIHRSRFLYFAENIPPQILKPVYLFFGIPLAQIMFPYVQAFYKSKDVINNVVLKFSCTCISTEIDALMAVDGQTAVNDRINTIAKYRDNNSVIVLDKNSEDMQQINTPITGLKEILYANLEQLPIICGIPTTKFLETSPTGLNATGEFDMRNFYDTINTSQHNIFDEPINTLNDIICYTKGFEYKGLNWNWSPLYQMSDREKAEVNRIKAETSNVYVQMGAITNADVARQLQNDKDSEYESIEIPEPIDFTQEEEGVDVGENGADSEIDKTIKDGVVDAEFKESKHPRNPDGTFKEKGGASENGGNKQEETTTNNKDVQEKISYLKSKIKDPFYDKAKYERLQKEIEKGKELGPRNKDYYDYVSKMLNEYNTSIEEEAKSIPPSDKASNILRQEAHNIDDYRYRKIDKDNFFHTTMANFNEVPEPPNREPDYISRTGSKYWYEDDGVYRKSNHWGAAIATCHWFLNNDVNKYATYANALEKEKTGFTKWENFTNIEHFTLRNIFDIIKKSQESLNKDVQYEEAKPEI